MSSSEGGGGSSDEQPDESVEYSGAKADGVMYLVFGVISIVVIVVVVLLVVFLMNRNTNHTAEPAMQSTTEKSQCPNPCMGAGKVCHPDSKKDADGCFVQDCHCYSPTAAHTCSNPCNATGKMCHFGSQMDEHGCYTPTCQCVTCKQECPMGKKCDPNTPSKPDGCPMSGCHCVPMMCPARCPSGRQCAPDASTDANGCFDTDCMCVPVSLATTPPWTPHVETPQPCPVVCPANYSCHKMQPVDASGCYVAPCPCIHNSCPNQCPAGQICELNTPLDTSGCLMPGCTCVPESGHVPKVVATDKPVDISHSAEPVDTDTVTEDPEHLVDSTSTPHGGRALKDDAEKDGANLLKRSPRFPENGNGSEARQAEDPSDNATVLHPPADPDHLPDTLNGSHASADGTSTSPIVEGTAYQSTSTQGEHSTPGASGYSTTGSANATDGEASSIDEKLTVSGEPSVHSVTESVTVGAASQGDEGTSKSSAGPEKTDKGDGTARNSGEDSSDVSADNTVTIEGGSATKGEEPTEFKEVTADNTVTTEGGSVTKGEDPTESKEVTADNTVTTEGGSVTKGEEPTESKELTADNTVTTEGGSVTKGEEPTESKEPTAVTDGNRERRGEEAPVTSTPAVKPEQGESLPSGTSEGASQDSSEEAISSEHSTTGEGAASVKEEASTDHSAAGEPNVGAEQPTAATAGTSGDDGSHSRVRRSVDAARILVLEPPVISLAKALVKGASTAFNATRVLAQAHRGGAQQQDDGSSKYAPILIPSVDASTSIGFQPDVAKRGTVYGNTTRRHGV